MQQHWSTWFTQAIASQLASYGINTLRIPIGYWAVESDPSTSYVTGAMDYLDQAIGWARYANMKVWVDLHGAPGSQNGYENSGESGAVEWQTVSGNINKTISVLTTMAAKYSGSEYSDVVIALELVNEPISWSPNDLAITRQFYIDAYNAVQAALTDNKDLQIIMHDSFVPLSEWSDLPTTLSASYGQIGLDTHLYQVYSDSDLALDGPGHVQEACSYASSLQASNDILSTYVGEWSAAENICSYTNGSVLAGSSCSESGCSCTTDSSENWSTDLVAYVRRFVEAQLDVFEGNSSGYFFWSQTGYGGWNFITGVQGGWIPQPLDARQYPGQCGFDLGNDYSTSSAAPEATFTPSTSISVAPQATTTTNSTTFNVATTAAAPVTTAAPTFTTAANVVYTTVYQVEYVTIFNKRRVRRGHLGVL